MCAKLKLEKYVQTKFQEIFWLLQGNPSMVEIAPQGRQLENKKCSGEKDVKQEL